MDLLKAIVAEWSWLGCKPQSIVAQNPFGNVIFIDEKGAYWRLTPEELMGEMIAGDRASFDALWSSMDFQEDWTAKVFCDMARSVNGELSEGRSYCLKKPGVIGGPYSAENMGTMKTEELIEFSGYLAFRIKDLPDGTNVRFTFE